MSCREAAFPFSLPPVACTISDLHNHPHLHALLPEQRGSCLCLLAALQWVALDLAGCQQEGWHKTPCSWWMTNTPAVLFLHAADLMGQRWTAAALLLKHLLNCGEGDVVISYYHPRSRSALSLSPQSPQFINAWVKTNSHPSAKWGGLRRDDVTHNFTAHLMLVTSLRTKSHLTLCYTSSTLWGEKRVWSSYLVNITGCEQTCVTILKLYFPKSLCHAPRVANHELLFHFHVQVDSVMRGVCIIKTCIELIHLLINDHHLNCAHFLQYKRQLVTLPNVNSQDEQRNKHYPHFLSWRGEMIKTFWLREGDVLFHSDSGSRRKSRGLILRPSFYCLSPLLSQSWRSASE